MTTPSLPSTADLRAVPRRTTMGLTSDSFQSVRFATPERLLSADRLMAISAALGMGGAHGGMTRIDLDWARETRRMKEELGQYLEIQTFLPREDPAVFEHAVTVAQAAGATSLRVVCLLGRRYEMFDSIGGWREAVQGFHRQIETALPIVERHQMRLGLENHKDWRVDEQVDLLQRYSSEYLGVSLDTGNNISILDDPMETVEKLAPYTFNVHLKDIALEECPEGFLMSEVPLGEGLLDIPRMVDVVRGARPEVHFSLEMITRDPLVIPCLTDKYWATFGDVCGLDLARMLARIRQHPPKRQLPRISGLTPEQRYAFEVELVERSIAFAVDRLGLGV